MATITLRKDKINGVGGLIDSIVKSSNKLDTQLGTLRNTLQGVDSSTCNLQNVVDNISSSSKSEKEKVADLKRLNSKLTDFITMTARRDADAKSAVERSKNDFYSKYSYLKPECEKNVFEHICDGIVTAAKWCKEHWKLIVTAIIVVVAVVLLCTGVGSGLGAVLLAGACWGAIMGACIGGVAGGLESMANGGSFLDGFEEGAFSGAISGAITGAACAGLGALGGAAGNFVRCGTALGKAIKGTAAVTKVLSIGMGGFDTLAMADRYFGNGNIAALNSKLHESTAYNVFQTGVTALAIFTGGMTSTMKCFVAGTLVLTVNGLVAIEAIKQGDMVYAANADTLKVLPRRVLETFVRETSHLVHLTVNGETIVSTFDHPYYVKGKGFVNACDLWIGAELADRYGNTILVENLYREDLGDNTVTVFNFKVEEDHTYFVSDLEILVHNATYPSYKNPDGTLKPNQEYTAGENGYSYKTDSNGNICSAHADELKFKTHEGRLKHKSNTPGKLAGDDAGHIFADSFGGSPDLDNLVSQSKGLNRSVKDTYNYRSMERDWSNAMKNGQKVTDVNIKMSYTNSSRPNSFKVTYKIDGKPYKHFFKQ